MHESSIMLLPEILDVVCACLPKRVLKQARQVSKAWDRAAVPYLFDEIFISQDLADFRIAKLVISHFKHYIRNLVFSSACYTDIDGESFFQNLEGNSLTSKATATAILKRPTANTRSRLTALCTRTSK